MNHHMLVVLTFLSLFGVGMALDSGSSQAFIWSDQDALDAIRDGKVEWERGPSWFATPERDSIGNP